MQSPVVDANRCEQFDVVVAGGGMAGIAAAIAAARQGAKTLLLEKDGWLGGMGIAGATSLHNFFNIFGAHPGAARAGRLSLATHRTDEGKWQEPPNRLRSGGMFPPNTWSE